LISEHHHRKPSQSAAACRLKSCKVDTFPTSRPSRWSPPTLINPIRRLLRTVRAVRRSYPSRWNPPTLLRQRRMKPRVASPPRDAPSHWSPPMLLHLGRMEPKLKSTLRSDPSRRSRNPARPSPTERKVVSPPTSSPSLSSPPWILRCLG